MSTQAGLLNGTWTQFYHCFSKGKGTAECTEKVSTKLFIILGVILNLNHVLKMHVILCAAPSEKLLKFPSLRILMFLSFFSTSQRGAGWCKLQQQFSGVMHAVVSEKSGESASRVPVLYFSPEANMVLMVLSGTQLRICPTAGLAMLVYNISRPPDMGVNGAYVLLQVSGKLSWQNWGEVGRKGKETSAHFFLWPQGIHTVCIGFVWASGRSGQRVSWSEAVNSPQT